MALCLLESELRKAHVRIIELRKLYIVIESFCCKKMLIDLFWRLRSDLECLREVWNTWRAVQEQHTEWKRGRWQRINTKLMKKATEAQLDVVSALPDESNEWNVFIGMHQAILNIQVRKGKRRASRVMIVCFLLSTFGYNFFWEPIRVIEQVQKWWRILAEIAWEQMLEIAWEFLCDRWYNFRTKIIQRTIWTVSYLVYSVCSSSGSKVITKQSMFFGRRFVYLFFPVGFVLNKTLRLGCLNVSSFIQQQVSSQLHFQVQIPFFPSYPSVVPNSNLHFFFVNSQLDASSRNVDFNCHFSCTVPGTSFRVHYFVKFNCGSYDFRQSLFLPWRLVSRLLMTWAGLQCDPGIGSSCYEWLEEQCKLATKDWLEWLWDSY